MQIDGNGLPLPYEKAKHLFAPRGDSEHSDTCRGVRHGTRRVYRLPCMQQRYRQLVSTVQPHAIPLRSGEFLRSIDHLSRHTGRQGPPQEKSSQVRPCRHLLAHRRKLHPADTCGHAQWRRGRVGHSDIRFRVVMRSGGHGTQLQEDESTELSRDDMLRTHGVDHTDSLQALLRHMRTLHRALGSGRGCSLYHGSHTIQFQEGTLHTFGVPPLRDIGRHLPHDSHLEDAAAICAIVLHQ